MTCMTFLRTSASCTPSNFGTPTRLGAAITTGVKSAPDSSARRPTRTRGAVFVVTRPETTIRKQCFTRSAARGHSISGIAFAAALGELACASTRAGPRVVFDEISRFGRVLVIDEGPRRVMRFGSPAGSEQSAVEIGNPRALPLEYTR